MAKKVYNLQAIFEDDLTTPTSTQNPQYLLGDTIKIADSANPTSQKVFMYVKAHAALTAYQPYVISYAYTAGAEVVTAAPATQTSPIVTVCVPQVAFTSGYFGFVQIQGYCTLKMSAETYASGDPLEVINTGATFLVNGTSGTPLIDNKTAAICGATGSSAASVAGYLLGVKVQNAAA